MSPLAAELDSRSSLAMQSHSCQGAAQPRLSAGPVRSQLLYAVIVRDDVPVPVPHHTAANALYLAAILFRLTPGFIASSQCRAAAAALTALKACQRRKVQALTSCVSEPSFSVLKSATDTTEDAALWNTRSAASSSMIAALAAGGRRLTAAKAALHMSCTAAERRLHTGSPACKSTLREEADSWVPPGPGGRGLAHPDV